MHNEENEVNLNSEDRNTDFFSTLTSGNYGLAMTYWVYGVLGGIVWAVGIFSVFQIPNSDWDQVDIDSLKHFIYLVLAAYYCAVYIGIWNSSNKFKGSKVWAILAKFVVIVTTIPFMINALKLLLSPLSQL